MPQPPVNAPREFKFVGGPSRKRRCRTGPGPGPRSARPAPGRPKPRPTSPQPTITVASEGPTASGPVSSSAAADAASGNNGVASPGRLNRDHPPVTQPHLPSNSPAHEDHRPGRNHHCSATPGAVTTSSSAAPGLSAAASATAGPTPNLARIDSTLPALQHANQYDGIEAGGFLDWPSADQMTASTMDDIGVSASTTNLFSPFDSIFQMPFFPTPDQLLQDPVELPGRGGFSNNPVPNAQGQKDVNDGAVDDIDLVDVAEPGNVDDQDSPVFGQGLSGAGSSDSTESIDRNDDSYMPAAPIIGNISEKFSRLFEQCKFIGRRNNQFSERDGSAMNQKE